MNEMVQSPPAQADGHYQVTRFNALRHGVLSRYTVLPWEAEAEYRMLLDALVAEHAPQGPTEEHLVEELTGIIWRKRRLRMAEAAVYREKLRHDATAYQTPEHLAGAALMPVTGATGQEANIPRALTASPTDTERDLRAVRRDQAMTRKAWDILDAGGSDAYTRALAALSNDTRACWVLADRPTDGLAYRPTAEALKAWIARSWRKWYEKPIAELEHRTRSATKPWVRHMRQMIWKCPPGMRSIWTASWSGR
jgi:hypothetical protein